MGIRELNRWHFFLQGESTLECNRYKWNYVSDFQYSIGQKWDLKRGAMISDIIDFELKYGN